MRQGLPGWFFIIVVIVITVIIGVIVWQATKPRPEGGGLSEAEKAIQMRKQWKVPK